MLSRNYLSECTKYSRKLYNIHSMLHRKATLYPSVRSFTTKSITLEEYNIADMEALQIWKRIPKIIEDEIKRGNRKDYSGMNVYTIDDDGTTCIDDGISIDDEMIYVHIANPAAFIARDSILAIEAREKISKLFPQKLIDMIGLQDNVHSSHKLVVTIEIPYDLKSLKFKQREKAVVKLGYIKTSNLVSFTFQEADAKIKLYSDDKDLHVVALSRLQAIADRIFAFWPRKPEELEKSRHMVEIMMNNANRCIKNYMINHGLPYKLTKSFPFTSPLRKYAQFVAQIQMMCIMRPKEVIGYNTREFIEEFDLRGLTEHKRLEQAMAEENKAKVIPNGTIRIVDGSKIPKKISFFKKIKRVQTI